MSGTSLASSRYVSLTTFRRSGDPVATPVWVAPDPGGDPDRMVVWTRDQTGKVKRLRHTERVTVTPCDARGHIAPDAVTVEGRAQIVGPGAPLEPVRRAMRAKYGWQFRLVEGFGRLLRRRHPPYVGISITV
ncbi:PPOX class F420-dependent oxidoreductase [Streptomyces sp. NPDC005438]|uniref:PPOX class F420-dependent oxidoreductase n=1 Tax=Streptomyces sp. NPDC005438 TaxID=3156880 RepID=UPI0033BA81D8